MRQAGKTLYPTDNTTGTHTGIPHPHDCWRHVAPHSNSLPFERAAPALEGGHCITEEINQDMGVHSAMAVPGRPLRPNKKKIVPYRGVYQGPN